MHKKVKEMLLKEYEKEMEKQDVTVFSKTYYEKILDLCRKKKIKVVAVVPPIAYTGGQLLGKYEEMRKFCEQNNIEYINYNEPDVLEEAGINFSTDFYNEGHLNALGSVKISKSLAKRLAKKYNLEDRREDPAYQSWNMAYKEFNKEYEPWFESIQN